MTRAVPPAPGVRSSAGSRRGSFKSSIPENAAGVTSAFENAGCRGGKQSGHNPVAV